MAYELRKKNIWKIKRQQGKFVREQEEGIIPSEDQVQEMIDEAIAESGGGNIDALIDGTITEVESNVTSIRDYAFNNCTALTTADIPLVTSLGLYVFSGCTALTTANFPLVTSVGRYAFNNCTALITADFPSATSIDYSAFRNCSALTALILRKADAICTLGNGVFTDTPIASGTGYIYVPSALVDTYKADSVWSTYANQFRALEDYTVDGTITGELDPSKI